MYSRRNIMGRFIKRKELTSEQYRRANKVMCVILVVCYVVFIAVEYSNIARAGEQNSGVMYRIGLYGPVLAASVRDYHSQKYNYQSDHRVDDTRLTERQSTDNGAHSTYKDAPRKCGGQGY